MSESSDLARLDRRTYSLKSDIIENDYF